MKLNFPGRQWASQFRRRGVGYQDQPEAVEKPCQCEEFNGPWIYLWPRYLITRRIASYVPILQWNYSNRLTD